MTGSVPFETAEVHGFLHRPAQARSGLVLTHGAGGNCSGPLLIKIAEALSEAGVAVLRFDLPFRRRRAAGPPSPATAAADREGILAAVRAMREIVAGPILVGGHSYGGRQATMLAADEPEVAAALLLLSYPLHPPGRSGELRTAHFPRLHVPGVFAHGTNDPFGSLEELRGALTIIPARSQLIPIEGAGHDLKRGRFELAPIVTAVSEAIAI